MQLERGRRQCGAHWQRSGGQNGAHSAQDMRDLVKPRKERKVLSVVVKSMSLMLTTALGSRQEDRAHPTSARNVRTNFLDLASASHQPSHIASWSSTTSVSPPVPPMARPRALLLISRASYFPVCN